MPDKTDPLESAVERTLAAFTAVSPSPEAEARWRLNLRATPPSDRCLGLSARSWAVACAACLLLACGLGAIAWVRSTPAAPRIVFSPPPAPVFVTPTAVVQMPPKKTAAIQPPLAAVVVPKGSRVAEPTPQEILLTRLVEEKPAVLAQMLKGTQTAADGEQQ